MELKDWIIKWSKPYWTRTDPCKVFNNITPDHYGQINLLWVMVGRPEVKSGLFDNNIDKWNLAGRICLRNIQGIPVRDYATLLTEAEFYKLVTANKHIFSTYLPMQKWDLMFKGTHDA